MRIVVFTNLDEEHGAPDVVVEQVVRALRAREHEVSVLAVYGDAQELITGLERRRPELVFNLCEMFGEEVNGDIAVAGLLDALRVRYTGSGPGELYLANDKALAKKILAFDEVKCPRFAWFGRGAELETGGGNLSMPLFVKPARMDASLGIDAAGLVRDATTLMKAVARIHEEFNDDALAEEYID